MSDAVAVPPEEAVAEEPQVPTRRLLVFEIAGNGYACEMDVFREIAPTQEMTRLPGAPDTVCGLINLRGTIVTVIDGGTALGKPAFKRADGLILLVDYVERLVGFGVDDVRDIQDVPIDQFGPVSETATPAGAVTSVIEVEGERVLVLDIKTVVQQVIGQGR
jgi:purine-binding chemotaxis protein CheW